MKILFLSIALSFFAPALHAAEPLPVELNGVGITEHLGESIDLNLTFTDETGATVPLKTFFGGKKPVVMTLAYYGCPNLCGLLLNGVVDVFKTIAWTPGQDFEFVNVSIDPTEKPELAAQKKENYLKDYGRSGTDSGWHLLTGSEANIQALARQIGFSYFYDKSQGEYAHGSAVFVLTPEGRLSRYLFGVMFEPRDMRLALLEGSSGKIGNIVDHVLLYCYRYDPKSRKYSLFATRLLKLGAGVTIAGIAGGIVMLRRKKC